MKTYVFSLFAAAMTLSSCRKDYTCLCHSTDSQAQEQEKHYPINDATKKEAKANCDLLSSNAWSCDLAE